MKLYYSPGACSLSPHIVLNEAGFNYEVEKVDLASKKTEKGADFFAINPKGYVPVLALDDGQIITEGPAIVQYLGDQKPASGIVPKAGTMERVREQEWLNFITSELHKSYSPLFRPTTPDEYKKLAREYLAKRLAILDKHLAGKQYILGDKFSAVDAYAFTVLRWSQYTNVDLSPFPNIKAFMERVAARPKVQETLKQEGLQKG
ncbi:MAG: glutathione transferase GstA [Alphaproteobacteria bacterium]|nr:glutathione transferase GstA [Alphaproteobacteria bacterium]